MMGENLASAFSWNLGINNAGYLAIAGNQDYLLDSTDDALCIVFTAAKAFDIDRWAFYVSANTGSPTIRVSLQAVDTNGDPDGTELFGQDYLVNTSGGMLAATVTTSYTCSKGTRYALVIEDGSTGNNLSVTHNLTIRGWQNAFYTDCHFRTSVDFTTGPTWTRVQNIQPLFALWDNATDDNDRMGYPSDVQVQIPTLTDIIDRICGIKFRIPSSFGRRVKVNGFNFMNYADRPNGIDYRLGIYDDDSSATVVYETADILVEERAGIAHIEQHWMDGVWLDTDTYYWLGIKRRGPVGASQFVGIYSMDANAEGNLGAFAHGSDIDMGVWVSGTGWVLDAVGSIPVYASLYIEDVDHGEVLVHRPGDINL